MLRVRSVLISWSKVNFELAGHNKDKSTFQFLNCLIDFLVGCLYSCLTSECSLSYLLLDPDKEGVEMSV